MTPTTYEQRLDENPDWALREGSMHFENESAVHKTLREIARRLDELGVAYAVAGGMALYFQGDLRFTEDVDILVTREGIARIHDELEGRGYLPPFTGSKNLRDTNTGVRIKFRVAGDYPGDGKPKPVAFPDPTGVAHEIDGIRFLDLQRPVELARLRNDASQAEAGSGRRRGADRCPQTLTRIRRRTEPLRPRQVPRTVA